MEVKGCVKMENKVKNMKYISYKSLIKQATFFPLGPQHHANKDKMSKGTFPYSLGSHKSI